MGKPIQAALLNAQNCIADNYPVYEAWQKKE